MSSIHMFVLIEINILNLNSHYFLNVSGERFTATCLISKITAFV